MWRSGVVHDHIPNHADAFLVGGIDEGSQLIFGTHVGIKLGPILVVVAVIAVVFKVALIAAANPTMDLFQW